MELVEVARYHAYSQPGMREQFSLLFVSDLELQGAVVELSYPELGNGTRLCGAGGSAAGKSGRFQLL